MPAGELLLAFVVAAVLIVLAPGPAVLFVASRALAYGRRVAVTSAAGGAAGTNPKTAVFLAAVLPQFVTPSAGLPPSLQMTALGALFAAIALISDTGYAILASAVRAWFVRSARRLELVGGAAGLTMVGLGVGLACTGRRD